jgi:membrane associated rhomboid family serine protease
MPQTPDLFVVCKKCGSEVSPYITECPYCGTRLRKRAPRIDRELGGRGGGRLRPSMPRLTRLMPGEIPGIRADPTAKPWATGILVLLSLFGLLVLSVVSRADAGVAGALHGQWWRVFSSPFLYANVWYQLAAVLAIGIFGWLLERRHGPFLVLALFALCGFGGIALDAAVEKVPLALGGNGAALGLLAAWAIPDLVALKRGKEIDADLLGALVIAAVLLLMPAAVPEASAIAGICGGIAGMLAGFALAARPRH